MKYKYYKRVGAIYRVSSRDTRRLYKGTWIYWGDKHILLHIDDFEELSEEDVFLLLI